LIGLVNEVKSTIFHGLQTAWLVRYGKVKNEVGIRSGTVGMSGNSNKRLREEIVQVVFFFVRMGSGMVRMDTGMVGMDTGMIGMDTGKS
jgi:hypothetical protein